MRSQCPDGTPPPCGARPARPAAAPAANTVAVMYLDNATRDTSDAYLADGLTEEITTKLGQVGRLAVTSHSTMRRYRDATTEPIALGRTLRVAQLVSGSVRRSGHRIRVSVELVRARDGVQLWADDYDRSDADLLAIEADVARAVASAIAGRLLPDEQATLAARPTRNSAAYDHFLRGNFYLAQRTPASARRAIAEFEAATSLDPGFALPFGRIGLAYALFLDWGWPFPELGRDSLLALGTAAADHALRLDSTATDGWFARGLLRTFLHPDTFDGVAEALGRATALDPNNAEAHHLYGVNLMLLGRVEEASTELRRALQLDSQRAVTWDNLAWVLKYQHRAEAALHAADSGLAADPQAYYLYADRATMRLEAGDTAGAEADAETAVRTSPAEYGAYAEPALAQVEAAKGDSVAARARLANTIARLPDPEHPNYTAAYGIALAFLQLGDRDRAIAVLEQARPAGLRIWFMTRDPAFDPIRDSPRFRALVERVRPPAP